MKFKYPISPYGGLVTYQLALVGGLNDSTARPAPTDFQQLLNFVHFRGRFALRAPIVASAQFLDDQGSPAPVTNMLGCVYYPAGGATPLYALAYSSVTQKVYLYACAVDASSITRKAVVWSGLSAKPRPIMAVVDGGTVNAETSRIYISDYTTVNPTVFWDNTAINTLSIDFAARGTNDSVFFAHVFAFQYHLWGTQFYNSQSSKRTEIMRFSMPGLIPAVEPNVGSGLTGQGSGEEWWTTDSAAAGPGSGFRSVGRRGDAIVAVSNAGGFALIHKLKETYALTGFDSQSWAIKPLSIRSGCVGPYATCTDGMGNAYWWSDRGPQMSNGSEVIDISEGIRKHVLSSQVSDEIVVQFSPDDGLVYFIYPNGTTATAPNYWVAWDTQRQMWSEADPTTAFSGGDSAGFFGATAIQSAALPGPAGAPSSLAATAFSDTQASITWTNGDTALDSHTQILWGTSNPPTVVQATVNSGISSFTTPVGSLLSNTLYFFIVNHIRNQQVSANSNTASATTLPSKPSPPPPPPGQPLTPSGPVVARISGGLSITLVNNSAGANILIYREQAGGTFGNTPTSAPVLITTLTSQPSGTIVYNDLTATTGVGYFYYAVAQVGSTVSPNSALSNLGVANLPMNLGNISTILTINWNTVSGGYCSNILVQLSLSTTGNTNILPGDTFSTQIRKNAVNIGSPLLFVHPYFAGIGNFNPWLSTIVNQILGYKQDLTNGVSTNFDCVVSFYDQGLTLVGTETTSVINTKVVLGTCAGGIT